MATFIQLFIDGLSAGSIYAALALAIVLVNQSTGLINFAQGGMAVLSAYIAWQLTQFGDPAASSRSSCRSRCRSSSARSSSDS